VPKTKARLLGRGSELPLCVQTDGNTASDLRACTDRIVVFRCRSDSTASVALCQCGGALWRMLAYIGASPARSRLLPGAS